MTFRVGQKVEIIAGGSKGTVGTVSQTYSSRGEVQIKVTKYPNGHDPWIKGQYLTVSEDNLTLFRKEDAVIAPEAVKKGDKILVTIKDTESDVQIIKSGVVTLIENYGGTLRICGGGWQLYSSNNSENVTVTVSLSKAAVEVDKLLEKMKAAKGNQVILDGSLMARKLNDLETSNWHVAYSNVSKTVTPEALRKLLVHKPEFLTVP